MGVVRGIPPAINVSVTEILLIIVVSVATSMLSIFVYMLITGKASEEGEVQIFPEEAKTIGLIVDILTTLILFYISFLK